jgi:hypothetical protein
MLAWWVDVVAREPLDEIALLVTAKAGQPTLRVEPQLNRRFGFGGRGAVRERVARYRFAR